MQCEAVPALRGARSRRAQQEGSAQPPAPTGRPEAPPGSATLQAAPRAGVPGRGEVTGCEEGSPRRRRPLPPRGRAGAREEPPPPSGAACGARPLSAGAAGPDPACKPLSHAETPPAAAAPSLASPQPPAEPLLPPSGSTEGGGRGRSRGSPGRLPQVSERGAGLRLFHQGGAGEPPTCPPSTRRNCGRDTATGQEKGGGEAALDMEVTYRLYKDPCNLSPRLYPLR